MAAVEILVYTKHQYEIRGYDGPEPGRNTPATALVDGVNLGSAVTIERALELLHKKVETVEHFTRVRLVAVQTIQRVALIADVPIERNRQGGEDGEQDG